MKHVDRTFILLLWGGLVGVLFYGCGRDASLSLSNAPLAPKVRLSLFSNTQGQGLLLDANGQTLMSSEGMTELSFNRGSAIVLHPKAKPGSKFVGWKVYPESHARVTDDQRLVVSNVTDDMTISANFEKLTQVSFQIRFNENATERANLVRWRAYYPDNKTENDYFPRDLERGRTQSKVYSYPYGTRIEIEGSEALKPKRSGNEFVLDQEHNVFDYTIDPNYR